MDQHCQIAVVGSGFSGSLTALALAQRGFDVVLLDRQRHPRFAIGESSTPAASLALARLAAQFDLPELLPLTKYGRWQQTLPQVRCGLKRGFSYFDHASDASGEFRPQADNATSLLVAANPDNQRGDTHWCRADVDAHLASIAAARGVRLWQQATITASNNQPGGWQLQLLHDDQPRTLQADFLIDATAGSDITGHAGLHGRRWHTQTAALFTHVTHLPAWDQHLLQLGADISQHPFASDDAAQHHLLRDGWVWCLRFGSRLASVGWVRDVRRPRWQWDTPESGWREAIAPHRQLADLFAPAQLAPDPGVWITSGRLQRMAANTCGPQWTLLPSSTGFVDPLHSTGIGHAIYGLPPLVECLREHWQRPQLAEQLRQLGRRWQQELAWIDLLVGACYRAMPRFRLFCATTMLYFAAATTMEQQLTAGRSPWFLCANERPLVEACVRLNQALHRIDIRDASAERVSEFESAVRRELAAYDHVGLCDPRAGNMYRYEVAE